MPGEFRIQNIHLPYLTFARQATDPGTPDADTLRLFLDDTDGKWKFIDENDDVYDLAPAGLLYEANRTTNLALTADTTAIDFNVVTTNVGSAWASGVFTAPATGLYQFTYNLCMTAATAYIIRGYVGGTAKVDGRYSSPGDQRHQVLFTEQLTAAQTFQARISASLTMDGSDAKFNWCRVARLA